jgi:hypothetical protein
MVHEARSRDARVTRKPVGLWDRVKFLLLITLLFWFFVWSAYSDPNPFNTVGDALRDTARSKWPLFVLFGIEAVRQVHYLIAEHSARYNHFWTKSVFGRFEKRMGRMNDWNRFRLARAFKVIIAIAILSVVLGTIYDVSPATALVELPARVWKLLPFAFQLVFGLFIIVGQFAFLFWFLSRGGVDTYMPEEVEQRFSDVWGQDAVLDRVKESMILLDKPDLIEEKGGEVPSGILLWGPPGTGKSLMASAVAGETGKPFVSVDPGAFINMFMGVGIIKVMSLFRKLRRLALRYGGVIVFFDEADSLGNRGGMMPGPLGGQIASPWDDAHDHLRWLSPESQYAVLAASTAAATPDDSPPRRADRVIMGGMGGGGMGTLQALLSQISGLKKPRGLLNRYGPADARHEAQAPAQVPHPDHDGHQYARGPRPRAAATGAHGPDVQGGLSLQGGPQEDVRGLPGQGVARAQRGGGGPARHHHALRHRRQHQGHGERGADQRHPRGREVVTWGDMMAAKHLKSWARPRTSST